MFRSVPQHRHRESDLIKGLRHVPARQRTSADPHSGADTNPHSGTDVSDHTGTGVSQHSGTGVSAHGGADVDEHGGTDNLNAGAHVHGVDSSWGSLITGWSTLYAASSSGGSPTSPFCALMEYDIGTAHAFVYGLVEGGTHKHTQVQPDDHSVTQPNNHNVTQPETHAVYDPANHSVYQPSNHVVTQPGDHELELPNHEHPDAWLGAPPFQDLE